MLMNEDVDSNYNNYSRINDFQNKEGISLSIEERQLLNRYDGYIHHSYKDTLIIDKKVNSFFNNNWRSSVEKLAKKLDLECEIMFVGSLNLIFCEIYNYKIYAKGDENSLHLFNANINGGRK